MSGPHHWSETAADNGTSDPNADLRPGRPANTVLGAIRGLMETVALARDDDMGLLVATIGANNLYTLTTNEGLIDPATQVNGLTPAITKPFDLHASFNTALSGSAANAPMIAVDGAVKVPLLRSDGTPLADGDLIKGRAYVLFGDMAAATDTTVTRVRVMDLLPSQLAVNAYGGSYGFGTLSPAAQMHAVGLNQNSPFYKLGGNVGGTFFAQDTGNFAGSGGAVLFGSSQGLGAAIKISQLAPYYAQWTLDFSVRAAPGDAALTLRMSLTPDGTLQPGTSQTGNIGSTTMPWQGGCFVNNPTVLSDRRLKSLRAVAAGGGAPTDRELDAWERVSPKLWAFKADEKGLLHAGYIAQEVVAAWKAEGLDVSAYALLVRGPGRHGRLALNYAECAVFEAAYQRREMARLSARVAALEARAA
ncbi:MAG: hypothetical protein MIL41_04775 [Hyphomicrobiales bacterium]|jgi:hypothetical protein